MNIISPQKWGARKPKAKASHCGKAQRIIIHHTAGHHPELDHAADESTAEAKAFAKEIQNYHMNHNGWNDSGHNFLVCRNGDVLVGRWGTKTAIENGKMVVSAHCPGQNEQIGIEHEHVSGEKPTKRQLEASAQLIAWISRQYKMKRPLPLHPHGEYFATRCPDNFKEYIDGLSHRAQEILKGAK